MGWISYRTGGLAGGFKLLQSSGARKAYLISALLLFAGSALSALTEDFVQTLQYEAQSLQHQLDQYAF